MPTPLTYGTKPPRVTSGTRRWLIAAGVIVIGLTSYIIVVALSMDPTIAQSVSKESVDFDLPAEATNISYRIGGAFDPNPLIFEFTSSEAAFRAWTEANAWPLTVSDGIVLRFDESKKQIANGLFYHSGQDDTGRTVAFDRDTGHGFYHYHSR